MFLFPFELPFLNHVVVSLFIIAGLTKLYLFISMGVCKSTKRLDGKTVLLTGGSTGIGKETALDLAKRGARVILACRDLKKAAVAKTDIVEKSGNKDVAIMELDLASLASIRKCAQTVIKNEAKLHILINNAGCAEIEKKITADGLEQQMQTNHFGHFLLTNLLLGLIVKTGEKEEENARIVNVSSEAHQLCKRLNLDDLNFTHDHWAGTFWSFFKIYGASKMCNILFTVELANKLEHHGKAVTVNCLHPGAVYTEFGRFSKPFNMLMKVTAFFWKTPQEGAQTTIYLAVADEVANVSGKYFCDCKISNTSKLGRDTGIAKKLWEASETLVNLKPEEKYF